MGDRICIALLAAVILGLNVIGWTVLLGFVVPRHYLIKDRIFGAGIGATAYTLGMRHAFDADHIAAIDNVTRKLIADGRRPLSVGFWFAMGHSSVVFIAALLVSLGVRSFIGQVEDEGSRLHSITGLVGSLVSGIFLYIIGVLNLTLFVKMVSILRKFRNGVLSEAEVEATISEKGFTNRVATRISAGISRSWHMFPIGFLFGLGFDTATEISLLFIAAGAASSNIPWFATMCLPVLFAAGMSLLDTIDGLLMNFAYGWAFTEPLRKIHYNIAITGLSVAVALVVGSIEIVQVVASNSGLSGGFWDWWANIDLNIIGFAVVGSFLAAWVIFYAELYVKAKR